MLYFVVPYSYPYNWDNHKRDATGEQVLSREYGLNIEFVSNSIPTPGSGGKTYHGSSGDFYSVNLPEYAGMTDAEKLQLFLTFPFRFVTDKTTIEALNAYILGVGVKRMFRHKLYDQLCAELNIIPSYLIPQGE